MCDEAVDGTQVDVLLDESSDGVDMSGMVTVLDSRHVYQGAIFGVDDLWIALPMRDGGQTVIRRQVMRHAPCVVMLVHDCANDLYLIEREYRIGCDAFAYGLPAGLIDGGEDVEEAALRELREETGVEPAGRDGVESTMWAVLLVRRHDRRACQHHGASPACMASRRTSFRRR